MIDDPEIPPTGVIPTADAQGCWRVWAPKAKVVALIRGLERLAMTAEPRGFFSVTTSLPEPGTRYAYSLDGGEPLPDPMSRWQPDGVQAHSAVWFSERLVWKDNDWAGVSRAELVIYELHVGTFTADGSFDAVIPRLAELIELGITAIELMPVAQFPGTRSWGYDGVFPFAVQNSYGGPEGLKRLVEACHSQGMAVILDAIYNHFGPEGNVLTTFGDYLTDSTKTAWGPAVNYDGAGSDVVRAMVLDNVKMWIRDYRIDGLRLDAADQIFDRGPRSILAEIAEVAHREGALQSRPVHVFAETDLNDAPRFLRTEERGGYALDGHWTDDFHHATHVALTGEASGYYLDFADGVAAMAKVFGRVFVNDGTYSPFRNRRHGTDATEFVGDRFVAFTQNHDQVGNRAKSDRNAASLSPAAVRLAAGLLLLAPRIPLLFMGEEYGETNPFPFFADFQSPELIEAVRAGRKAEFAYFGWDGEVADPFDPATRDSATLSWDWHEPLRAGLRQLYQDLLRLRRGHAVLRDFRHPEVELIGTAESPRLLKVVRKTIRRQTLTLLFNLEDSSREIPSNLSKNPPTFRSEVERYGANPTQSTLEPFTLAPWEFVIFGLL